MLIKSFSLIELMVVIAIIAVLSVVATSVYSTYSYRSKITSAGNVLHSIADRAIHFAQVNGHFPDAHELGFSTVPGDIEVDSQELGDFFPYLRQDAENVLGVYGDTCGQSGLVFIGLSGVATGIPNGSSVDCCGALQLVVRFWQENGILRKYSYYTLIYGGGNQEAIDLLPGSIWINPLIPGAQVPNINTTCP